MTAAHRLRGVGWLGSCAFVVLAFYLVSLQVAAERNRLGAINASVVDAQRDIRALETEFDTRANLAQLERWNGDTLALTAPVAGQFVADESALAAIDVTAGPMTGPDGAVVRTAQLLVPSLAGVSLQTPVAPTSARAAATIQSAPVQTAALQTAALQTVSYQTQPTRTAALTTARPVPAVSRAVAAVSQTIATTPRAQADMLRAAAVANVRPQAVAMLDRKLLSDSTLGAILSGARAEADRRR